MRDVLDSGEKVCPICGGEFLVPAPENWVYKTTEKSRVKYFCGWSCYSAALRSIEKAKKKEHNRRILERAVRMA